MRTYLFIFPILFSGFAFGQEVALVSKQGKVTDSLEIKSIANSVDSIRLDNTLQIISLDSILLSSKYSKQLECHKLDIYCRGSEILRITISESGINLAFEYSVGGSIVDYFLEKNKLIFADEKYTDNSRTGSCGAIEMQNKLYFSNNELIQTRTIGGCYEPRIKLEWLYGNFEKAYQISIDKMQ